MPLFFISDFGQMACPGLTVDKIRTRGWNLRHLFRWVAIVEHRTIAMLSGGSTIQDHVP